MEQKKNAQRNRWKAPLVAIFVGIATVVLILIFLIALPYFATRPLSKHDLTNLPTQK
jgi:hypothetical protein